MVPEDDPCEGLPPDVPNGVTVIESDCDATITWNAANCSDNYRVQRSGNGGSTWTTLSSSAAGTSYSDLVIINGVSYIYQVHAQNTVGKSNAVSSNSVTGDFFPALSILCVYR